jgi:beta-phosphoglucomutase
VRAIVFDFDGVIANSEPLHFRAYRDVLLEEQVVLTDRDYYDRYLGYDDRGAFEAIAADRHRTWSNALVPIAVASGALGQEIRRVLDRSQLARCFSAIVAAEDTRRSKPAPDPYLRAVALLADAHGPLEPADCVAVEDSRWGLESARAAGLRTVGVAHTYASEALAAADLVIPSMLAFDPVALQKRFP